MAPSLRKVLLYASLAVLGLGLLAYLWFWLSFGAADHAEVSLEAHRVDPDEIVGALTYDPPPEVADLLTDAIRNGSVRTAGLDDDPVFAGTTDDPPAGPSAAESVIVAHDGAYYRVTVADKSAIELDRPTLTLDPANGTPGAARPIDELPAVDRRKVERVLVYRERGCEADPTAGQVPPCWVAYSTAAAERSVLLDDAGPDHVRVDSDVYAVTIRNRSVRGTAITYRAERLATGSRSLVARVVPTVDPERLPAGERRLFERAIDEGFHRTVYRHDLKRLPRDRLNSLLPKLGLPSLDAVAGRHRGSAVGYVEYNGTYYRVTFAYKDTYA